MFISSMVFETEILINVLIRIKYSKLLDFKLLRFKHIHSIDLSISSSSLTLPKLTCDVKSVHHIYTASKEFESFKLRLCIHHV